MGILGPVPKLFCKPTFKCIPSLQEDSGAAFIELNVVRTRITQGNKYAAAPHCLERWSRFFDALPVYHEIVVTFLPIVTVACIGEKHRCCDVARTHAIDAPDVLSDRVKATSAPTEGQRFLIEPADKQLTRLRERKKLFILFLLHTTFYCH